MGPRGPAPAGVEQGSPMTEIASEVLDRIRTFFMQTFPLAETKNVGVDDNLFEAGVLDSMGMIEVILFLKSEFDVDVDGDELRVENFGSMRAAAEYVTRNAR